MGEDSGWAPVAPSDVCVPLALPPPPLRARDELAPSPALGSPPHPLFCLNHRRVPGVDVTEGPRQLQERCRARSRLGGSPPPLPGWTLPRAPDVRHFFQPFSSCLRGCVWLGALEPERGFWGVQPRSERGPFLLFWG